jgi:hypothetical protein
VGQSLDHRFTPTGMRLALDDGFTYVPVEGDKLAVHCKRRPGLRGGDAPFEVA